MLKQQARLLNGRHLLPRPRPRRGRLPRAPSGCAATAAARARPRRLPEPRSTRCAHYLPLLPLALADLGRAAPPRPASTARTARCRCSTRRGRSSASASRGAVIFTLMLYVFRLDERAARRRPHQPLVDPARSRSSPACSCSPRSWRCASPRATSARSGFNYRTVLHRRHRRRRRRGDRRLDPRAPLLGLPHPGLRRRQRRPRRRRSRPRRYPVLGRDRGRCRRSSRATSSTTSSSPSTAATSTAWRTSSSSLQEQGIRTRFALRPLPPHPGQGRARGARRHAAPLLLDRRRRACSQLAGQARARRRARRRCCCCSACRSSWLIALLIKLTSGGNVLFRQTRCGLNGRLFTLYKFRTMVEDAEERRARAARTSTR